MGNYLDITFSDVNTNLMTGPLSKVKLVVESSIFKKRKGMVWTVMHSAMLLMDRPIGELYNC